MTGSQTFVADIMDIWQPSSHKELILIGQANQRKANYRQYHAPPYQHASSLHRHTKVVPIGAGIACFSSKMEKKSARRKNSNCLGLIFFSHIVKELLLEFTRDYKVLFICLCTFIARKTVKSYQSHTWDYDPSISRGRRKLS